MPNFQKLPLKHPIKLTIAKGHEKLHHLDITHTNVASHVSIAINLEQTTNPASKHTHKKKETPLKMCINYPLSCCFLLSTVTFHLLNIRPCKNLIWLHFIIQHETYSEKFQNMLTNADGSKLSSKHANG